MQAWIERLTIWRAMRTIVIVVTLLVLAGAFMVRMLEPETFDDFGISAWWAVTTVSTVGYGDIVPVTTEGRLVGTVLMIAGVSMIPLVTSIVVSILTAKRARAERQQEAQQIAALNARLARIEEHVKRYPGPRSAAIRARRGAPASRSTVLITAANGTARIAPTTPRMEPAISTATIVVKPDSSTAWRYTIG